MKLIYNVFYFFLLKCVNRCIIVLDKSRTISRHFCPSFYDMYRGNHFKFIYFRKMKKREMLWIKHFSIGIFARFAAEIKDTRKYQEKRKLYLISLFDKQLIIFWKFNNKISIRKIPKNIDKQICQMITQITYEVP